MPRKGPATIQDRLSRIEGQVRGVKQMVEDKEETRKVMIQVQAAIASLERVRVELVKKEVKKAMLEEMDEVLNLLK